MMDKAPLNYARNKSLRNQFNKDKSALADFLSLTFERYLSGTTENNRIVTIRMGTQRLEPLNPLGEDFIGGYHGTIIDDFEVPYGLAQ